MNAEITVALLSAAGTLIGSLGGILASNRLTNYRIAQLEKRVDKHNNLVERMAAMISRAENKGDFHEKAF